MPDQESLVVSPIEEIVTYETEIENIHIRTDVEIETIYERIEIIEIGVMGPPGRAGENIKGDTGDKGDKGDKGETGDQGIPGSGDKNYIHVQNIISTNWPVPHNLGKRPTVAVVDSAGSEIEVAVEHIDDNNLLVVLSYAISGKVYCN